MLDITIKKEDLKRAFRVTLLAISEHADKITSHSYLKIKDGKGLILSTDGDKMAFSHFSFQGEAEDIDFTADPKKMLALIGSTENEDIRLTYENGTKTLKVFASENSESSLSFASFNTEEFLSFEPDLEKLNILGTTTAEVLVTGFKFIQGFLPEEKNPKSDKYTRLYASKGVLYGANGSNKVGAFQSDDLACLDDLIIRQAMISPISGLIDRSGISSVVIATTSKFIFVMSENKDHGFGFLRTNDEIPKYPISIEDPVVESITVNRPLFLKKLNRLAISFEGDSGIKSILSGENIKLSTLSERTSTESLTCKRSEITSDKEFVFDHKLIKSILNLFLTPELSIYLDKFRCILISSAELEITDTVKGTSDKKAFKAVALMSLARAL